MDLTFLIPTRIETEDRLRNIISSVSYLLRHVPAKVIVKESSGRDTFRFRALPEIRKHANTENLTYLFEENNDPLFCKSKVLNDLIVAADTKVVANYDADCILPISSYKHVRFSTFARFLISGSARNLNVSRPDTSLTMTFAGTCVRR